METTEDHGIPEDDWPGLIEELRITQHTEEDCQLSNILASALADSPLKAKTAIVSGNAVWVQTLDPPAMTKYRIAAGTRRRLLNSEFEQETFALEAWKE